MIRLVLFIQTGQPHSCLGIATTPYHPTGNGQAGGYNGIVWKAVRLSLKSANLADSKRKMILPDALGLFSTLLRTQLHMRDFFEFQCRSTHGTSLPTWLQTPEPVPLRR